MLIFVLFLLGGIISCLDGISNRDSFRFDDDGFYFGLFCGRVRVYIDFILSFYDIDFFKIKVRVYYICILDDFFSVGCMICFRKYK